MNEIAKITITYYVNVDMLDDIVQQTQITKSWPICLPHDRHWSRLRLIIHYPSTSRHSEDLGCIVTLYWLQNLCAPTIHHFNKQFCT